MSKKENSITSKIRKRAKQLKTDIPAVFLALRKKETPIMAKIIAAITIAYALSPIDLIPDFIPVIGFLDDVLILPGLIAMVVKMIPPEVFAECRKESEDMWKNGKPKKWYYALPIILIWGLLICLIVNLIW